MPTVPFKFVRKTTLGLIYRPYIIIKAQSTTGKWIPLEVIVDTGADYTLFPKKYSILLGIDLADCKLERSSGVGGKELVYQHSLRIKIGSWQTKIPVGFLPHNNIPGLLGRLDCLEKIKVVFERRTVTLETT